VRGDLQSGARQGSKGRFRRGRPPVLHDQALPRRRPNLDLAAAGDDKQRLFVDTGSSRSRRACTVPRPRPERFQACVIKAAARFCFHQLAAVSAGPHAQPDAFASGQTRPTHGRDRRHGVHLLIGCGHAHVVASSISAALARSISRPVETLLDPLRAALRRHCACVTGGGVAGARRREPAATGVSTHPCCAEHTIRPSPRSGDHALDATAATVGQSVRAVAALVTIPFEEGAARRPGRRLTLCASTAPGR